MHVCTHRFLSLMSAVMVFSGCRHAAPEAHAGGHHHRFDDANAWAARFEDPSRDAWQKPDEVIALLALPPDATVADIGSATGYFPVRLAKAVPQGRVVGVDLEQSMVDYLHARAEREGLKNLSSVRGTGTDANLPAPVDLILMVDTYHHIEDRPAYFTKLAASLKPGGRLVIIDFTQTSKLGPPRAMKVPPEQVTQELQQAGYRLVSTPEVLPEQFLHIYTR